MGIQEQIEHDVAEAMRARDEHRLSTLRLIRAAIKNAEIEQRGKTEAEPDALAIAVIKRHVKQTQEAITDFERGGRADLIERAREEIVTMQKYLPEELADEAISAVIEEAISAAGPTPHAGKLIGDVMKRIAGRADGVRVRNLIELRLKNM
ncbi:MAG: GatB/YqeY domain-containing protein [Candidatus Magasanikbacteria bacterium]|nr:GatB/YqeY domain-containing protein [Candidatus Magasanikbacteria bacterium]